jgi:hypothetical protein
VVGISINSVDALRQTILFQWQQLALIIALGVAVGGIPGWIIKWRWRSGIMAGNLWDFVMKKVDGKRQYPMTKVVTSDNQIYEGTIFLWGRDQSSRDLLLVNPAKLITQNGQQVRENVGTEIYFPEASIKEIIFETGVTS